MSLVLDYNLFASTFDLFGKIETELTFDETHGVGTASTVWETEDMKVRYYNHAWRKFMESDKMAPKFYLSFKSARSAIVRQFGVGKLPNIETIATIAHFVQNEIGGWDLHTITSDADRQAHLQDVYCNASIGGFTKNAVSLWKEMLEAERNQFYFLVVNKIVSYIPSTLKGKLMPPPTTFYRNEELLAQGYAPVLDFMNGPRFIWCRVPLVTQTDGISEAKRLVYTTSDTTVGFTYTYKSEEDTFEYAQSVTLRYTNGEIVDTD